MVKKVGTANPDSLTGTAGGDELFGLEGSDLLLGLAGNDYLDGGAGDDDLRGGLGDDIYIVDHPEDIARSVLDPGADIVGAMISYSLGAHQEHLKLLGTAKLNGTGNAGANQLIGNSNSNVLKGAAGNDFLDGEKGDDDLQGGDGDDRYVVDHEGDINGVLDDLGSDIVQSSISYRLGDHQETLVLTGTKPIDGIGNVGNNILQGNDASNALIGKAGDDILRGLGGDDLLFGGAGNDQLIGGAGIDLLMGEAGNDTYFLDADTDIDRVVLDPGRDIVASSISYTLGAHQEDLYLQGTTALNGVGNAGDNTLFGNSSVNQLTGGDGNDYLDGGAGDDDLVGGIGNDTYVIDHIGDLNTATTDDGNDTVVSSLSTYTLGDRQENLQLAAGTNTHSGTGNSLNNTLIGNAGSNTLTGLDGADYLDGGAGDDDLVGGNGHDTYLVDNDGDINRETSDDGTDTVNSSLTNYTLGAYQERLFLTGSADLNGEGNAGDNQLTGNSGSNILLGGNGNDTLDGEAGDDNLQGQGGDDRYEIDHLDDIDKTIDDPGTDRVVSSLATYTLGEHQEILQMAAGSVARDGNGNDEDNHLIGNAGSNILVGGGGADKLEGGGGSDVLDGSSGIDELYGDGGQDTLRYDANDLVVDGGSGDDALTIDGVGLHLDLTTIANDRFIGLERINFIGANDNSLTLAISDVLALSDTSDTLYVNGNSGDQVTSASGGSWVLDAGGPVTFEGQQYHGYTSGSVHLFIDTDITQFIS
jgi:trimeric autotransporter adhesin